MTITELPSGLAAAGRRGREGHRHPARGRADVARPAARVGGPAASGLDARAVQRAVPAGRFARAAEMAAAALHDSAPTRLPSSTVAAHVALEPWPPHRVARRWRTARSVAPATRIGRRGRTRRGVARAMAADGISWQQALLAHVAAGRGRDPRPHPRRTGGGSVAVAAHPGHHRRGVAADGAWSRRGHGRQPRGCASCAAGARRMPVAAGIFRPAVIMPADADTWSESRLRVVLLHELAHVKRRDCLTHVLAQAACAFHWFNPLAWLAVKRARDRARAGVRRSGAGVRHARLRLRRSAARDGARAARRSLPGAARRRQPGDGAPVAARRPADRDSRSAPAALRRDAGARACGRGAVLLRGRAARRAAAVDVAHRDHHGRIVGRSRLSPAHAAPARCSRTGPSCRSRRPSAAAAARADAGRAGRRRRSENRSSPRDRADDAAAGRARRSARAHAARSRQRRGGRRTASADGGRAEPSRRNHRRRGSGARQDCRAGRATRPDSRPIRGWSPR